jgi:ectoine hydroxylase-related dioxygenase (phytanoyl-CoA dioxygenase family)
MRTLEDNLPALASDFGLTKGQLEAYQRDGHITLRQVLTREEAAIYRPFITDAVQDFKRRHAKPLAERDTYGKAFLQVGNLWENDENVKRFVFSRRLAGIAAQLMGAAGTRLYHDQALYKEGRGGLTPWHQDQFYWPLDTNQTITLWMPLVPVDDSMGVMRFASGSHKDGFLGHLPISDKSEATFQQYVADKGFTITSGGPMMPGDCTFHSGWTLHSAPPNQTDMMREVMTIIYYADGVKVLEPDNGNRKHDRDRFLPGLKGGDLAVSKFTPLLYP